MSRRGRSRQRRALLWENARMAMLSRCARLLRTVACLGVFTLAGPAWAQAPTFSITLTGQSMIRSDIRAHVPAAVPVIKSLLKGDVVFTNFETTILDVKKGQSPKDGRFLSPPEALESLIDEAVTATRRMNAAKAG